MIEPGILPLLSRASQLASASLLSASWQAGLLILAAAVALRAAPRANAAVRSTTWTAVLLLSVLLPLIAVCSPQPASARFVSAPGIHLALGWSFAFAGLWVLLSSVRLFNLASGALRLRAIWLNAIPVPGGEAITSTLSRPGSRPATLCTSRDVAEPSVIGFLSPRILIPHPMYDQLSRPELEHIVLHEMEHLSRRDDWINLLQKLALVLFPLNPALIWVERRLSFERELACDEGVLRATNAPKSYATSLVNLAEHRLRQHRISLALGAWGRQSELARRVHHILQPRSARFAPRHASAFTAVVITALACGATALSRTPRLISFSPPPASSALASDAGLSSQPGPRSLTHPASAANPSPFVEAVMHVPSSQPALTAAKTTHPLRFRSTLRHAVPAPRRTTQSLVLTSWTPTGARSPSAQAYTSQVAFAVLATSDSFSSYAAVSTADGWFIVQL